MIKRIVLVLALLIVSVISFSVAMAQQTFTDQDAIKLAQNSPIFHDVLEGYPGWAAAAYDTQNTYGIWHVQFTAADGDDLGWADVSPAHQKVYSWESHIGATDTQRTAAEPILRDFVNTLPAVTELIDNPSQYNMWVDYNGWAQAWSVYIDRGSDSLSVLVQFDGKLPTSLENPHFLGISFPQVLSYSDWAESKKALAVATAFKNPQIADALSAVDNWTTATEKQDDTHWVVSFKQGDTVLAQVTVDLATNQVVASQVGS